MKLEKKERKKKTHKPPAPEAGHGFEELPLCFSVSENIVSSLLLGVTLPLNFLPLPAVCASFPSLIASQLLLTVTTCMKQSP